MIYLRAKSYVRAPVCFLDIRKIAKMILLVWDELEVDSLAWNLSLHIRTLSQWFLLQTV